MKNNELKDNGVFADPTVDFTFKRIFGTERFKQATIGLLNSIIEDQTIVDVSFINVELNSETAEDKRSIIDVLCTDQNGNNFIVEMQRSGQYHFRERMVYYASKAISLLSMPKGQSDYSMKSHYVIAFLTFSIDSYFQDNYLPEQYCLHYVTNEVSTGEKLPAAAEYFFFDLTRFQKPLSEACTETEIWLYLLKESKYLTEVPQTTDDNDAYKAYFEASKIAGFTKEEALAYEKDMLTERDRINSLRDTYDVGRKEGKAEGLAEGKAQGKAEGLAEGKVQGKAEGLAEGKAQGKAEGLAQGKDEGLAEGKVQGKTEIAKTMKAEGLSADLIAKYTGLTVEQISQL